MEKFMALKESNEITVKLTTSKEEIISQLITKGFKLDVKQYLEDFYFIPENLDVKNNSIKNILSHSILIRNLYDITKDKCKSCKLCYKLKEFNNNDEIINQKSYNVEIYNPQDAKNFLKAIGYYQILNINEYEYHLIKNGLTIEIKEVINGELLMEVETINDEKLNTIQKIKAYVDKLNLPIDKGNFFVKKAEIELKKALQK